MNEKKFETTDDLINITQNHLRLNESTLHIGLFWFSNDLSTIIRIEGEKEIDSSDLLKPNRIDPIGVHAEYSMPRDTPRGRINYENHIFNIWVGDDNPLEDEEIIKIIKDPFNLQKIDSTKFQVKRHYHWNTKN